MKIHGAYGWILSIPAILLTMCSVTTHAAEKDKEAFRRPVAIPFPANNPYTAEKAALGKALFFDPRLSGGKNMTCASCHNPSFGWEVPVKTAIGSHNEPLARQAPTILNTAWLKPFFWDGRASTAEEQAKGPIEAPVEMNLPLSEAVRRLEAVPGYAAWFKEVFPNEGITGDTIVQAIATFERTVVSEYTPFDKWVSGDETAISSRAKRGFEVFVGKGRCASCHSGWTFTDNKFHDVGTTEVDLCRGVIEPDNLAAQYAFKTPTLRDIANRAPYMHDGTMVTLEEVLHHYVDPKFNRPSTSPLLRPVPLTQGEIADLIAFLKTLTGPKQPVTLPTLPN